MLRSLAESVAKILKKGNLVYLEGEIRTHSFTDKAGLKTYATEIVAELYILPSKKNSVR
jgi:single-strand DNA-binding protein